MKLQFTQHKARTLVVLALVLVFGGIFAFDLVKSLFIKRYFAHFQAPPVVISAAPARAEIWQPSLKSVGTLKAVHGVDISAEVSGTVHKIYVHSGEAVTAGQALLDLEDRVDQQSLKNLRSQWELTQLAFQRQQKLLDQHVVSKADYDQASANLKQAEANFNKEQELLALKHIRAPFSGKLGILAVDLGQYISPGTVLVTLQSMHPLYLNFSIPEQSLSELALGETVRLMLDSYPNEVFEGKITAISPKVDLDTHTVDVQATVPNENGKLIPGLFAKIELVLNRNEKVIVVPNTAVTSSPYGNNVFVITEKKIPDSKEPILEVTERVVSLGETKNHFVSVEKGLKAGERVVTSGQLKLHTGSRVIIDNRFGLE